MSLNMEQMQCTLEVKESVSFIAIAMELCALIFIFFVRWSCITSLAAVLCTHNATTAVFNWHVRHVNGNERKFSITEEHVRCVKTNEVMHTPFLPSIIGKYFTHRHRRRHLQMLPVEFSWETFSLASGGAENWWTRQKSNSERHRRGRFSHTKRKSQRGNCIINRERQKEDHVI